MRKRIIIGIIIICIILAIVWRHSTQKIAPSDVTTVQIAPVTLHSIPLTVTAVGVMVAPETVMLKSRVAGIVNAVYFKSGEWVEKDTLLVQLQDITAKANVAVQKANLFQNKVKYDRYLAIQKTPGAVSPETMDEIRAAYDAAVAQVDAAEAALKDTQIRAPFAGYVGALQATTVASGADTNVTMQVNVGSYVSAGDSIVYMSNPDVMVVQYSVSQDDSRYLKLEEPVSIQVSAYPNEIFQGHVTFISPVIDAGSHTYNVYALMDNKKHLLKSGMNVMVTQTLVADRSVLAAQGLSLVPSFTGYLVYVVENGKIRALPVTVGERDHTFVEIKSGLTQNQSIIISNVTALQPGQAVKVEP